MTDSLAIPLGHDIYLIDVGMYGEPERMSCYLFDTPHRVLVECGPSLSCDRLFATLDQLGIDDVATLAVTHIHLDHSGGAGQFARRFPRSRVAAHSRGVRHLADPSRLWASATSLYGDEGTRRRWGPLEPVDQDRLLALEDGDRIQLSRSRSLQVLHTPGHARHHVVFSDSDSGACMVGDALGLSYPLGRIVQPTTPPPDLDPDLLVEQLHRIASLDPSYLALGHFGTDPDCETALAAAEESLRRWVNWVREDLAAGVADLGEALRHRTLEGYRDQSTPDEVVALYDHNTPWPMMAAGIAHWLSREGTGN
jgi:glyoxylase-like metal-dependent hydrolase (beta-lactamase superfamily II)